jgi:hypothetical protein
MKNLLQLVTESVFAACGLLLSCCLCCCIACEVSKDDVDNCVDELPPDIRLPATLGNSILKQATISVDEIIEFDESDNQNVFSMLSANFSDLSQYQEGKIPAIPFSEACVGLAGQGSSSGIKSLTTASVIFKGLFVGEQQLSKNEAGVFENQLFDEPIFTPEGGETISAIVTTDDDEDKDSFPGFAVDVLAPSKVQVDNINLGTDQTLEIGWAPGESTFFEAVLTASSTSPGLPANRLRCILKDDGCHSIPPEAIEWFLSQGTKEFTILLKRHNLSHIALSEGILVEIDAQRSVEMPYLVE